MKIAVYPGSFDPVTNGHLDIVKRASLIFDKVIVAVLNNTSKAPLFSIEERLILLRESCKDVENVEFDCFSGLLIDYVKKINADVIVKGLRAVSDFEYELQMALMNRSLNSDVETFFMMTSSKYSFLSSSLIKEVAKLGGNVTDLVPDIVEDYLHKKYL